MVVGGLVRGAQLLNSTFDGRTVLLSVLGEMYRGDEGAISSLST